MKYYQKLGKIYIIFIIINLKLMMKKRINYIENEYDKKFKEKYNENNEKIKKKISI